jgi:hypothetical protein
MFSKAGAQTQFDEGKQLEKFAAMSELIFSDNQSVDFFV